MVVNRFLALVGGACAVACGSAGSSDDIGGAGGGGPADASEAGGGSAGVTGDAQAETGDATSDAVALDAGSRCVVTATSVYCDHNVTPLHVSVTVNRDIYWQTPLGAPPAGGWPVVVLYQGSFFGPSLTWGTLAPGTPFGGFNQGLLQARLLDHGFTVVAPSAAAGLAWQTNAGVPWSTTTDVHVIDSLLAEIAAGRYGPADPSRLYATGISSGGYMTSRMAVSYAGRFRALAVHSGSYATCLGPVCNVPASLPADHPPTLFLHGSLDTTVPIATMMPYHDRLAAQGVATDLDVDPQATHEWLADSPSLVTSWFETH